MSARTFARRFVAETGTTPHQWVTDQRVLRARQLLEESDLPVEAVARAPGSDRPRCCATTSPGARASRPPRSAPSAACRPDLRTGPDLRTFTRSPHGAPSGSHRPLLRSQHDRGETATAARILVVEDEPMINQAVTDRLRAEGFAVDQAHDGPGAVAAFEEHAPDLVVLDVMLPGLRRARGVPPHPGQPPGAGADAHRPRRRDRPARRARRRRRRLRDQAVLDARGRRPHPAPCCAGSSGPPRSPHRRRPHRRRRAHHRRGRAAASPCGGAGCT